MERHILQTAWKPGHGRISNGKTELKGQETADGQGSRLCASSPDPASGCWQWLKARVSGRPGMQVKQPILRHPTARTRHRPTTCPRSSTESPTSWPPSQSGANQGGRPPPQGVIPNKDRQRTLRLLRTFSPRWLPSSYGQVFLLWAVRG